MQPQLAHRVGRTFTGLATLTVLALGACKNNATGPGTTAPTGVYKGTIVGSAVSGVLTITFPAAAAAPAESPVRFSAMGSEASTPITGTLKLQGSSTTITLTGTYDPSGATQLNLSGGSYVITGNYTSGGFVGSFTGPSGGGQFTALGGTVTVFCGAYSGTSTGYWNLVLSGTNLSGLATNSSGPIKLGGVYTAGATPNNAIISIGSPTVGTAQGNLNTSAGTGSGTWTVPASSESGNWTTSATCL